MAKTDIGQATAEKASAAKRQPPKLSMELDADNVMLLDVHGDIGQLNRATGNLRNV
jgi:hypothetical protein